MSAQDSQRLDPCGCCEASIRPTPQEIHNRPGLPAIAYRVGTYASFRQAMIEAIAGKRQLRDWTARTSDDYGIALPEMHKSREFAWRWHRRVCLAYYDRHESGHEWAWDKTDAGQRTIHVNRVQALDEIFDRLRRGKAQLPSDARHLGGRIQNGIGEYYRKMAALSRVLEQNAQGNWVSRYVDRGKADHYAHAETYCLLAMKGGFSVRPMVG